MDGEKIIGFDFRNDSITRNFAKFFGYYFLYLQCKQKPGDNDLAELRAKEQRRHNLQKRYYFEQVEHLSWILEDSDDAIRHFINFGLEGVTKISDTSESYLRLYGFLNSTYLQYQAILTLYDMFWPMIRNSVKEEIRLSTIIVLRNKIAAHSPNFEDGEKKEYFTYKVSQASLRSDGWKVHILGQSRLRKTSEEYDLKFCLEEFNSKLHKKLLDICEYILRRNKSSITLKYDYFEDVLYFIKRRLKGDLIEPHLDPGKWIIMTSNPAAIRRDNEDGEAE